MIFLGIMLQLRRSGSILLIQQHFSRAVTCHLDESQLPALLFVSFSLLVHIFKCPPTRSLHAGKPTRDPRCPTSPLLFFARRVLG